MSTFYKIQLDIGTYSSTVIANAGAWRPDANSRFLDVLLIPDGGTVTNTVTSTVTPAALAVAPAIGTSPEASRADHVHVLPTAAQVGAAPTVHGHTIPDVAGLQPALDAKLDDAQATAAGLAVLGAATHAAQRTLLNVAAGATANATDAALRDRATHTGTQLAATISDFATAVSSNAAVAANTTKVTNATHTGEVTGATALTIANDVVTNAKLANVATATIKGRITAAVGDPEDLTAAQARTVLNVADGATANATDAALRDRATHTGTQAISTVIGLQAALDAKLDDSQATAAGLAVLGAATHAAQRTLLNVADGATANAPDASLRDRATHTGTQLAATISDFAAASRAQTEASILAGTNITITPAGTGATRTLTIAASGGGGGGTVTSTVTPAALAVAPAIGTSPEASRADHVHVLPTAAQVGAAGPSVAIRTANAATNFGLTDRGNAVAKDDTGSYAWTILNDATTLWADNATILCCNDGASGNVTITPGSGVTLTAGTATGAFTLAPGESRLLHRRAANNWRIR